MSEIPTHTTHRFGLMMKKNLKVISHFPMHTTHRFRRNKIKVVKHTLMLSKSSLLFWFFHQTKYIVPLTFAMPKIHQAWIHWRIKKMLGTIYYPDHYDIGLDWLYLLLCSKWPRTPRTDLVIRWKKLNLCIMCPRTPHTDSVESKLRF